MKIQTIIFLFFLLCIQIVFAQMPKELHAIFEAVGKDSCAQLGSYVKGVGDLNKDGYADVAVSAQGKRLTYVYYGGKTMSKQPSLTFVGGGIITSGDFNGDGWIDLAIEKWARDTVNIYLGGVQIDTIPDLILTEPSDYFGHALATGDVNGDGFTDLIIGTLDQNKDSTLYLKGRIFVYAGNSQMQTIPATILIGDTTNARLGIDLATGDINGDGKMDIIALGYNRMSSVIGNDRYFCFSIFLGESMFNFRRYYYIDSYIIPGGFKDHITCFDADGDGIDDILVNKVYIFKGETQLDTIPTYYIPPPNNDSSRFGSFPWVSGGGDFNKDGVKDILLSRTEGYFGGVPGVYVFLGRKNRQGQYVAYRVFSDYLWYGLYGRPENAGDVNGDGVDDIIIGAPMEQLYWEGFFGIYSGDTTLVTEVGRQSSTQPESFEVKQNYPNPFNPSTTLCYQLSLPVFVSLKIFDILGREVTELVNEHQSAGLHTIQWNASSMPSGVYFYRLEYGGRAKVGKMLMMR